MSISAELQRQCFWRTSVALNCLVRVGLTLITDVLITTDICELASLSVCTGGTLKHRHDRW